MNSKGIVSNFTRGVVFLLILIIVGLILAFVEFPADFGLPLNSPLRILSIIVLALVSLMAAYFTIKDNFQSSKSFKNLNNKSDKHTEMLEKQTEKIEKIDSGIDAIPDRITSQIGQVLFNGIVTSLGFNKFSELNKKELAVFKFLCEDAITNNKEIDYVFDFKDTDLSDILLEDGEIFEIIATLNRHHFIEAEQRRSGFKVLSIKMTTFGLEAYASTFIEDYEDIQRSVINLIFNENVKDSNPISQQLNVSHLLVMHILTILENEDYLNITRYAKGMVIFGISPDLKKKLKK